jgi:hypothetical protein
VSLRPERCAGASEARGEPLVGTASVVRSWLLLEHPGPWGRDAFVDARLPEGLARELRARCRASGVRPLLVRRAAVAGDGSKVTCFAIRSGPEPPRVQRTALERIEDALELDLDALGRGRPLELESHDAALFLVCTHGRHDPCCAERGRPLARALASALPDQTWESSHFGGDRFAANVIAFPHGFYFGRVPPANAETLARAYLDGRLALEHLRGRSCHSMAVQAAEHELRVSAGLDGVDDVELEDSASTGEGVSARFRTPRGRFEVRLAIEESEPQLLTCRSSAEERAPAYRALAVRPLS